MQDYAPENTIKQFINFCTKAIDLIKLFQTFCFWNEIFCSRDRQIRNVQLTLGMNQLSFLSLCDIFSLLESFYFKNCYCRWQKWDNKTNKYRNAVNRAHKSQFSINFISHFWTKTKQFLAADVCSSNAAAAAVHWKINFQNLLIALCSALVFAGERKFPFSFSIGTFWRAIKTRLDKVPW